MVWIIALVIVTITFLAYYNHRDIDGYQKISADEAVRIIDNNEDIIILDVRSNEEFLSGHLKDAVSMPLQTIENNAREQITDLKQTILVYCRSGSRSRQAANKLIKLGYQNVFDFGGIIDWHGEIVK